MEWLTNVEGMAEWIRSWEILGIMGSIVLNIIISVAGVLPSIFLSGANAIVYGLVGGFFVSLTGEVLGATVAFLLYRYGLQKSKGLKKLEKFSWIQHINGASRFRKGLAIVLLRMNPLIPSGVINLGAALTTISFADFLLATLVGKIPSMVFETFVGHDLVYLSENKSRLIISLLAGSLVFLLFWKREKSRSS
ncbi:VTT domain-containing protein [Brevibacillus nitrificans]|uniref:TVP38/TMEM64 family protein n=1 Tax=Brevibacillus nitrificans TaxID=651560 RepID=UPI0028597BE9|nr:VTT domain-containing protein [Brevibacillus nitrificans]MDR7313823.1 putative membrane protein YdjX (TVP38/TMEM64 family) [Brevibacillus nitrificans]